nr:immunoglobulin light chain junction region [Macaca mulatta]
DYYCQVYDSGTKLF